MKKKKRSPPVIPKLTRLEKYLKKFEKKYKINKTQNDTKITKSGLPRK